MKFQIDTVNQNCTASSTAKPVFEFGTKNQKLDENGEPVFSIEVVLFGEAGAEVLPVKFSGQPPVGVKSGTPLRITGLMASTWAMEGGRNGVSFKAAKIEIASGAPMKAAS